MTLCVYAIVRARPGRIGVTGLAGERLHAVTAGPIAAIVGRLRAAPRPSEATVRAYDRTVRSLARRVPALLPARFGTCVRGEDELRAILGDREPALRRALAAVRDRVQMTVRIVDRGSGIGDQGSGIGDRGSGIGSRKPEPDSDRSQIPDPRSLIPDPRSPGRSYLKARAAAAARERAVPAFEPLRPAVQRWVRAERVEKRGDVATLYHLVPRRVADRYRGALEKAARDANVRLLVSGPWPAYAFADGWQVAGDG